MENVCRGSVISGSKWSRNFFFIKLFLGFKFRPLGDFGLNQYFSRDEYFWGRDAAQIAKNPEKSGFSLKIRVFSDFQDFLTLALTPPPPKLHMAFQRAIWATKSATWPDFESEPPSSCFAEIEIFQDLACENHDFAVSRGFQQIAAPLLFAKR